jgi:hypothetical protein
MIPSGIEPATFRFVAQYSTSVSILKLIVLFYGKFGITEDGWESLRFILLCDFLMRIRQLQSVRLIRITQKIKVYSFNSCSAEVVTAKILRDFRLPPQCR